MKTYHLWAEHTAGQSIGHPCSTGVWDDPTERLDCTIDAESEADAETIGMQELEAIVAKYTPCDCRRKLSAGNDRWWSSVRIVASLAAYPEYVGDAQ